MSGARSKRVRSHVCVCVYVCAGEGDRAKAHHLCVALVCPGLVDGEEEDDALATLCATCGCLGVRWASVSTPVASTARRGTQGAVGRWQRSSNERAPTAQSSAWPHCATASPRCLSSARSGCRASRSSSSRNNACREAGASMAIPSAAAAVAARRRLSQSPPLDWPPLSYWLARHPLRLSSD